MKQFRLPIFLYCIVIIFVFGSALWPAKDMLLYGDDIHRAYYFFREFFNQWWHVGVFPWWNPDLFGGQPFIADPVVNIWYPPNWLFFVLPLNLVYSWHIALHILWAMMGMYVLLKADKEFDIAAWVSGVVFGLSGFFMARTFAGHVDVIAAASWMPWMVWAFYELLCAADVRIFAHPLLARLTNFDTHKDKLEKRFAKNTTSFAHLFVKAAVIFALQLLSGYQTMAFFTVIAIGMFSLLYAIRIKSIVPLFRVGLAGVAGLLLAAIQILPEQEFFGRSIRTFQFPYIWHSYGSYEWRSLLQFLNPFQFGNQYTYNGPPPNFIEHSAFVGVMGLALSVIGILTIFRKKVDANVRSTSVVFGLLVFFGLWVSLGPNAPIDLQKILWQFVPMYHHLRIPPRHLILVVFGLAGLAGFGLRMVKHAFLQRIIGCIVAIELIFFGHGFIDMKPVPEVRHDKALITLLQKDVVPYRVLQNFGVWLPQRDSLDFDGVMAYNIQSATGYDPSILRSYYEFVEAMNKSTKPSVLDHDVQVPYMNVTSPYVSFLGIKYLMVPSGTYDPNSGQGTGMWALTREDKSAGYRLYTNTKVLERFFFVSSAQFYKTRESIIFKIRQDVDLQKMVLIRDRGHEEALVELSCKESQSSVNIVSYTPNMIELSVKTSCDTYLSSSEIFYPGWRAFIDGKETAIYESNIAFRTLFVPKGDHTIVFTYRPTIFVIGGGISLVTLFGLYILWRSKKNLVS